MKWRGICDVLLAEPRGGLATQPSCATSLKRGQSWMGAAAE